MTEREMVEAFHRAMDIPVREKPEVPSEAERLLRCRLLLEETLEFITASGVSVISAGTWLQDMRQVELLATHEPDLAAMAHENADVRVITIGTDLTLGAPSEVLVEVMRANMAKRWPDGTVHKYERGKVLKPPGFAPADVAGVLERHRTSPGDLRGVRTRSGVRTR